MATVKKIPQRQCIGCGQMKDKKDLIRILKTQDESIVIDATGRKNGRVRMKTACLKHLRIRDLKGHLRWQ